MNYKLEIVPPETERPKTLLARELNPGEIAIIMDRAYPGRYILRTEHHIIDLNSPESDWACVGDEITSRPAGGDLQVQRLAKGTQIVLTIK